MIGGSVANLGQFDAVLTQIRQAGQVDLKPLADQLTEIIRDDNRAGLLGGIDATGAPMKPLTASTQRRRGRDGDGDGAPGVPDGASSSLISGYQVDVQFTANGLEIHAGWSGEAGQKARFFHEGTRHQVARPIVGLRPATRAKIQAALDTFAQRALSR